MKAKARKVRPKHAYTINGEFRQANLSLFRLHMLDHEADFLTSNLRRNKWNVSKTAKELGITFERCFVDGKGL